MLLHVGHFAFVEAKLALRLRVRQLLLRAPKAAHIRIHLPPPFIGQHGQVKLTHPLAIGVVAWIGELLRADIRIQPIRQWIVDRLHMPAGASRCFKKGHVMSALHQVIRTAQTSNATAYDDDTFLGSRCRM